MKIILLPGSFRKDSLNHALARGVAAIAEPDHEVEIADYRGLPFYDGDLESQGGVPEAAQALAERIRDADVLLIVTPEYNSGPPAILKNVIDWLSRLKPSPFNDTPVALMGATPGRIGTLRVQMQLRQTFQGMGAMVVPSPMVLVSGAKLDAVSEPDEGLTKLVRSLLDAASAMRRS